MAAACSVAFGAGLPASVCTSTGVGTSRGFCGELSGTTALGLPTEKFTFGPGACLAARACPPTGAGSPGDFCGAVSDAAIKEHNAQANKAQSAARAVIAAAGFEGEGGGGGVQVRPPEPPTPWGQMI
mmetsp:Transcript_15601/g.42508  ORF Transcript_15601/g.42508 Transcript_15601/m.42508 type:complete len:127 (-) Transcript_15601:37-417(-)